MRHPLDFDLCSFQELYYMMLVGKHERLCCDGCSKLMKQGDKVWLVVPHVRDDQSVDKIFCERCKEKVKKEGEE